MPGMYRFPMLWKVPADLHDNKPAALLVGVVPLVSILQPVNIVKILNGDK